MQDDKIEQIKNMFDVAWQTYENVVRRLGQRISASSITERNPPFFTPQLLFAVDYTLSLHPNSR